MVRQADELLAVLEQVDRMVLVRLAELGRGLDPPPAFRGRCLEPAYLEAVARGVWTADDETLLAQYEERLETVALARVRRLDRRSLRAVLRGALLAALTEGLDVPGWPQRRTAIAAPWLQVQLTLPHPGVHATR